MAETFNVKAILTVLDVGFKAGMERAKSAAQALGSTVSNNSKTIGTSMAVAGAATTAMGVTAAKNFGAFQQSLNQAAVIAGGTSKDIAGLADVANKMGADLPISAQSAAEAMVAMARDGASISSIKSEFPAIARAATAAGADLQTTGSVVQQAMNIWGDSLKSPAQAAATLTATANMSNASIEDMQQALATIGSTASASGMSLGQTTTAIGLLTNKGFSAAQASQDLNHALLQMQAPSSVAKKQMDQLGLSFVDSQGKMKSFPTILQEISSALDGMSSADKTKALKAMFGTAGMQAIAPLLKSIEDQSGKTTTSWNAYSNALDKAAGSTAAANKTLNGQAAEMQKNLGSKIEQLGGNWEALSNKAMQSSGGVNGAFIDMANGALSWANTSNSSFAKFIQGFIGISPVLGSTLTVVGGVIRNLSAIGSGISAVVGWGGSIITFAKDFDIASKATAAWNAITKVAAGVQAAFNAVMALNPIILIVAAVAAVVVALTLFFTKTKAGQKAWASFTSFISGAWEKTKNIVVAGLSALGQWWNDQWNSFTSGLSSAWSTITSAVSSAWNGIKNFITSGLSALASWWNDQWNSFTSGLSSAWSTITSAVSGAWNGLKSIITTGLAALASWWGGQWNAFTAGVTNAWNVISAATSAVWNGIVTVITVVWTAIVTVVTNYFSSLFSIWSTSWNLLITVASAVWNGIVTVISVVWNTITSVVSSAISAVSSVVTSVFSAISSFLSGIMSSIASVFTSGWNKAKSITTSAMNAAKNAVNNAARATVSAGQNFVMGFVRGITGFIGQAASAAARMAKAALSAAKGALGIHSPSRVMRDEVGYYVGAGMAKGILGNTSAVEKASEVLAKSAVIDPRRIDMSSQLNRLSNLGQQAFSGNYDGSIQLQDSSLQMQNNALLRRIAEKGTDLYLDGRTLVGGTLDTTNEMLGNRMNLKGRWN